MTWIFSLSVLYFNKKLKINENIKYLIFCFHKVWDHIYILEYKNFKNSKLFICSPTMWKPHKYLEEWISIYPRFSVQTVALGDQIVEEGKQLFVKTFYLINEKRNNGIERSQFCNHQWINTRHWVSNAAKTTKREMTRQMSPSESMYHHVVLPKDLTVDLIKSLGSAAVCRKYRGQRNCAMSMQ